MPYLKKQIFRTKPAARQLFRTVLFCFKIQNYKMVFIIILYTPVISSAIFSAAWGAKKQTHLQRCVCLIFILFIYLMKICLRRALLIFTRLMPRHRA